MTADTNPDWGALFCEAHELYKRVQRGDLSAVEPLAAIEQELAVQFARVGVRLVREETDT